MTLLFRFVSHRVTALLVMFMVSTLLLSLASANPLSDAPPPLSLLQNSSPLTQMMDDPLLMRELEQEESLQDLQNVEYNKEALSVSRALLLSVIPGGGWSLMYANRRAQGVLMVLGSVLGYSIGAAYLLGVFDEQAEKSCLLTDSSKDSMNVELIYCNPASSIDPKSAQATMPAYDPYLAKNDDINADPTQKIMLRSKVLRNDGSLSPDYRVPFYSEVKELYQEQRRGTNYDGTKTGLSIIAGTYAVTTILSAIWSAVEISDQNHELRKRIESTSAQAPHTLPKRTRLNPTFQYDGQQTIMGLGGQF